MGSRRKARENALQMLFQYDFTRDPVDEIISTFWQMNPTPDQTVVSFANQLFRGTVSRLEEIDQLLQAHAKNWRLERMASVDRNVMRLAVYELLTEAETPPAVIIDEAIEIAKKYSTEESAQFVNGILDGIKRDLDRSKLDTADIKQLKIEG